MRKAEFEFSFPATQYNKREPLLSLLFQTPALTEPQAICQQINCNKEIYACYGQESHDQRKNPIFYLSACVWPHRNAD